MMVPVSAASAPEARLLVVEDEPAIRDGLYELFSGQGYAVEVAGDGHAALERLAHGRYDLVVLDVMMPGPDGFAVLGHLRARGDDVLVLLLTARGAEDDVVRGLEAGADDYVTKPFGVRELSARVKGLLARRPRRPGTDPAPALEVGPTRLDLEALRVVWPGGELVLTAREADLLAYLAARAHRPVGRDELLVDVWGYSTGDLATRTVDVHIQQLRAKLRQAPGLDEVIETVRGKGYRFAAPLRRGGAAP